MDAQMEKRGHGRGLEERGKDDGGMEKMTDVTKGGGRSHVEDGVMREEVRERWRAMWPKSAEGERWRDE